MAKLLVQTDTEYREQLELGKAKEEEARRLAESLEAQGASAIRIRLQTRPIWQAAREAAENAIIWEWGTQREPKEGRRTRTERDQKEEEAPAGPVNLLAAARSAKLRRVAA